MLIPNLSDLRKRLTAALDDPGLDALCLDHFPQVYATFSRGLRRDEKINITQHERLLTLDFDVPSRPTQETQ
jgi:hypothetical protein